MAQRARVNVWEQDAVEGTRKVHDAITSNTYQSAPSEHAGNAGSEGSWERKVMATQREACTSHEGKGKESHQDGECKCDDGCADKSGVANGREPKTDSARE